MMVGGYLSVYAHSCFLVVSKATVNSKHIEDQTSGLKGDASLPAAMHYEFTIALELPSWREYATIQVHAYYERFNDGMFPGPRPAKALTKSLIITLALFILLQILSFNLKLNPSE